VQINPLLLIPVLIFSIILHEVAHAWQARREGDDTAERLGRITLNPIPHMDLFGSVLLPLVLYFGNAPFLFGWAKPVPVNPENYRDIRWGDVRVSLAGIVSNLGLAVVFTLIAAVTTALGPAPGGAPSRAFDLVSEAAYYGVFINLVLAFFNLIPIPPLDGSHVLYHVLPARMREGYRSISRFGIVLIFAMVFFFNDAFQILLAPVSFLMNAAQAFVALWA
jgi:Zn-dependent protease